MTDEELGAKARALVNAHFGMVEKARNGERLVDSIAAALREVRDGTLREVAKECRARAGRWLQAFAGAHGHTGHHLAADEDEELAAMFDEWAAQPPPTQETAAPPKPDRKAEFYAMMEAAGELPHSIMAVPGLRETAAPPAADVPACSVARCGHVAYRGHDDMCIDDDCHFAAYQVVSPAETAPQTTGGERK